MVECTERGHCSRKQGEHEDGGTCITHIPYLNIKKKGFEEKTV
jgi:hypothetical protein